jgi:DNA (cytosine-5)-methyltransferase 1
MSFSRSKLTKSSRRPVGIDLFSGAGGLSLGFEQAGFDIAASIEIDPIHCAVHEFNFPHCTSICTDAAEISGSEIRVRAGLGRTPVEVVFGGAPCQGFSLIGKRALDDPRNSLLLQFLRLVVELDANYFVFENVRGLTIGEHRQLLEELIGEFRAHGYNVLLPYRVLNAADFGVPQDRLRVFLMGAKDGLPLPTYPQPQPGTTTVWEALGDLPDADGFDELLSGDTIKRAKFGKTSSYAKKLRELSVDEGDFSHRRIWPSKGLTSSMRTIHTPLSKARFEMTENGKVEPVSRFFKLHPDGVSNTLRAGTGSERGAFTSPRPIHPHAARVITVREAARLHSFPDWFRFHVTKWHGFRQVGNSVPPLLGRAVAAELIAMLRTKPERPFEKIELGDEALLRFNMTEAAAHYGVASDIAGKRLRLPILGFQDAVTA